MFASAFRSICNVISCHCVITEEGIACICNTLGGIPVQWEKISRISRKGANVDERGKNVAHARLHEQEDENISDVSSSSFPLFRESTPASSNHEVTKNKKTPAVKKRRKLEDASCLSTGKCTPPSFPFIFYIYPLFIYPLFNLLLLILTLGVPLDCIYICTTVQLKKWRVFCKITSYI